MAGQLDGLDEPPVGGLPRDDEAALGEGRLVFPVELVPVPVPLVHLAGPVDGARARARGEFAGVAAQPHRPPEVVDPQQVAQLVDDLVRRVRVALGGVGALDPAHVAGELDRRPLEAVADAEVGDAPLAGDAGGPHHAPRAPVAEPAGDEDAVGPGEQVLAPLGLERLRLDPLDVDGQLVAEAPVIERLVEALVGVLVPHVLADDVDAEAVEGAPEAVDQRLPRVHRAFGIGELQPPEHVAVEPFVREDERNLVDARHVPRRDHRIFVHVAEQRDLPAELRRQDPVGAAQQDVGLNADRAQIADAVLRRLGLELARGPDERHQGQVDVERVVAAHVLPELPDGLQERLALDVADGAADLHQHDVHVLRHRADAVLDLVGDVGDDLHRAPEVVAAALLLDDRQVDLAGGPVVVLGGEGAGEALVVAEVEVGLGPVVGDVDLAVLVGAHGARVHVDVGVELLQRHPVAVPLEQAADGGGGEPLAEGRHHPAGDEDELHGAARVVEDRFAHAGAPAATRRRTRSRSAGVSTPMGSSSMRVVMMR